MLAHRQCATCSPVTPLPPAVKEGGLGGLMHTAASGLCREERSPASHHSDFSMVLTARHYLPLTDEETEPQ